MRFSKQLSGLLFIVLLSAAIVPSLAVCIHAEDQIPSDSVLRVESASEQMKASVEAQIRAFAKSINQANADDAAAKALAKHGLTGGGKKLSVGKSHPLTATLWNSELLQNCMIQSCSEIVRVMQNLSRTNIYGQGGAEWYTGDYYYFMGAYKKPGVDKADLICSIPSIYYQGSLNEYDSSLEWMVGSANIDGFISREKTTSDAVTYNVTFTISDRFDFSTSSNSSFKNLISGLAAALFREFDWESTVSFQLTVPNSCRHTPNTYYYTYDFDSKQINSDYSNGYTGNLAQQLTKSLETGIRYYYKLNSTVYLMHNRPWILEYTVKNPNKFAFAPEESKEAALPYILNYHRDLLILVHRLRTSSDEVVTRYYGTALKKYFQYNTSDNYTFRLQNIIAADGSNMIYLTIYNQTIGETVLKAIPLDDYYEIENGSWILKDTDASGISGVDFAINYIGNVSYGFSPDYFDLKIWENGVDGGNDTYFTSKVTAPTCASQGYTTYTCTCCGYSYQDAYTAKTEHKFGSWQQTTAPTCVNEGVETRTCTGCGTAETRPIAAAGHSYLTAVTKPTCTEDGYTTHTCHCGDTYVDNNVAASGHKYGEWSQTNAPTCTAEGEETRICAGCTAFEARKVTATGHSHVSSVTAPTCTEGGYTTHTCHCGDMYVDGNVSAIGHTRGDWIVDTQPQVGIKGSKHIECTVCRVILQTESIEALPEPEIGTETEPETTPKPEETKDNEGIAGKIVIGAISFLVLCFAGYLLLHKKRKK